MVLVRPDEPQNLGPAPGEGPAEFWSVFESQSFHVGDSQLPSSSGFGLVVWIGVDWFGLVWWFGLVVVWIAGFPPHALKNQGFES